MNPPRKVGPRRRGPRRIQEVRSPLLAQVAKITRKSLRKPGGAQGAERGEAISVQLHELKYQVDPSYGEIQISQSRSVFQD